MHTIMLGKVDVSFFLDTFIEKLVGQVKSQNVFGSGKKKSKWRIVGGVSHRVGGQADCYLSHDYPKQVVELKVTDRSAQNVLMNGLYGVRSDSQWIRDEEQNFIIST